MRIPLYKKRINLATKFNLLTISLVIATAAGTCFFLIRAEVNSYYEDLLNHGKTIANTTARNCEFGIFTENEEALTTVLEGLSVDSVVAYVSVVNTAEHTLAARAFRGSGVMQERFDEAGLDSSGNVLREFVDKLNNERYTEIVAPVVIGANRDLTDALSMYGSVKTAPSIIGRVRLGLSHEGLRSRIKKLVISAGLVTSLLVLIGMWLTIVMTRKITSPLKRLTVVTKEVSEGKFDSPIEIRTNDELSDLATSFDHMRDRMRTYTIEVEERAAELSMMNEQLFQEVDARKAAEQQLLHDALHDTLTGLPNRTLFVDRLAHVIRTSKRRKDFTCAVLFLDLDRFKIINDSLGHTVGDHLLIAFGERIMTCLRPGDTVARLGGDEFSVLLEDVSGLANATYIAERISKALGESFRVAGHEVFVTASIGIALGLANYERPDQILRDADTAMYQAKTHGKARYAVFEAGMHANAVQRLQLETDLRRAIERNEFVTFYQPILLLSTNRLVGFEALVRWLHPERGLLNPGDFMPMAEETGMIVAIDRLVLRESCRQMLEWQNEMNGSSPGFVSVNLSNKQMVRPDLVEHVAAVLQETGLDPGRLKLEITENVIIENPEETVVMLTRLKALGVRLYIDDFGTGYSSLSYLHRLPIDGLKIDRSFIKGMGENGENQEIVRMILLLARDMNIDVIAEGLETQKQVAQIQSLQCEYGQGYLFSKPVDSNRARAMIERLGFIEKPAA